MEDILTRLIRGVRRPIVNRRALFLCGTAGSGKTTFIKQFLDDADMTTSYVYVNPDELPTREILGDILFALAELGYSMVVDATCRNRKMYLPFFEFLKQRRYRITMGILYVPLETSLSRVAHRKDQPVSPEVVRDIYAHTTKNIESYMHLPELFLYSNGRLVFHKNDNQITCLNPSAPFYFPLSKYCQNV